MAKIKFKRKYPAFQPQHLETIAHILVDGEGGLTGSQLAHTLASCNIPDVDPTNTKWKRLFNAFVVFQNDHQVGNHVIVFIQHVMNLASHIEAPEKFYRWRNSLNKVLALNGMELGKDGKLKETHKANTLDDALARANRLKASLEQRKVHSHVMEHCRAEVLADNYFHAVLEAMKSITTRIRTMSELDGDGAELVKAAFGGQTPILKINLYDSSSRKGEQRGFVSLLTGMYGMFRNPVAHEVRIEWDMSEQDALDIMTTISMVHRKLDVTTRS